MDIYLLHVFYIYILYIQYCASTTIQLIALKVRNIADYRVFPDRAAMVGEHHIHAVRIIRGVIRCRAITYSTISNASN